MREVLFRGKGTCGLNAGDWIYGYYVKDFWKPTRCGCGIIPIDKERGGYCEVDPSTIGQYTGLTDKNGKKIFEGDIIRYADMYDYNCYLESLDNIEAYDKIDFGYIWTVDEIVYGIKTGYPAFDLNNHYWDCNGLSELNESGNYFYEVIGNIYDNPELLKGIKNV